MTGANTVRAIRQSLQVIQASGEHLAESGGCQKHADKITREIKKIDAWISRLETELTCPHDTTGSCPLK